MAESTKIPGAKPAARRHRTLGAALAACWYLLVYTHLASYALAQFAPANAAVACTCGAMAGGTCCSPGQAAGEGDCALPDENMGCRGPRSAPSACLLAAPCGGELPAAPQTAALTWPHLAGASYSLQPAPATAVLPTRHTQDSYSLSLTPPEKVPRQYS